MPPLPTRLQDHSSPKNPKCHEPGIGRKAHLTPAQAPT